MGCPDCGGRVSHDSDGMVCTNCGLVIEDTVISFSQEWRAYDQEEFQRRARAGLPETPLYSDRGLLTDVGEYVADILLNRTLSPHQRAAARRLHRLQRREKVAVDRTLTSTLQELHRICSLVELPKSARKLAAGYVREARQAGIFKGRSITSIAAASVLLSARVLGINRHHAAVARAAGVDIKTLLKTYRLLKRITGARGRVLKPETVLPEVCSRAGVSQQLQRMAHAVLKCLREKEENFSGHNPYSIAASALYFASVLLCPQPRLTQREAAEAAGVTTMTVRNWYRRIACTLNASDVEELLLQRF